MLHKSKRWQVAPRITPEANLALRGYPPVLRQILYNRGYTTLEEAQAFLEARPPKVSDPFILLNMLRAVERLEIAIRSQEPIAVYGDYDVDGVTSTALLVEVLQALGANVTGYIPNRFEEGYGLNNDALQNLREQGICLVVSVDCGIRSPQEADFARSIGLDLIITDHHHPSAELPAAYAIVNPKLPGDPYPDKDLAGVGIAYKLASALVTHLSNQGFAAAYCVNLTDYLDLVALGTVADLAPLTGENRYLVRNGLKQIRSMKRQGILSLMLAAGLKPERISAGDVGYVLGPRLNAAGRIDTAIDALILLTTKDVETAGRLAQTLDNLNQERHQIMQKIQEAAEQMALAEQPDSLLLFAAHPSFNKGVIGLAASRLTETYYRPAIVAQIDDTHTRGSCRSIAEFHITDALDECADILEHHGGHAAAAGFSIRNEHLDEFVKRLQAIAARELTNRDLRPVLSADVELPLRDLHPSLLEALEWLQPTGYGNRQPMFVSRDLYVKNARQVGKGAHLKLVVTDGWITFDAIAFKQGHREVPGKIDILYSFEENEYNGRSSLQLNVKDFRPAGKED